MAFILLYTVSIALFISLNIISFGISLLKWYPLPVAKILPAINILIFLFKKFRNNLLPILHGIVS